MLCPVLARLPLGLAILMSRARPLSEDEAERLRATRGFPDWGYGPPDYDECPFEPKASDWGRLPDGRLVALDYSAPGTRLTMGGRRARLQWRRSPRAGGAR
jgi:hypothetical protein